MRLPHRQFDFGQRRQLQAINSGGHTTPLTVEHTVSAARKREILTMNEPITGDGPLGANSERGTAEMIVRKKLYTQPNVVE